MNFCLGKQFAAVGGDQLLAGEIAYKTLQRPYRRWMKMRLGFFQRHDRGAVGPCFEKRREQHQYREALRAFAVTLHGNLGPAEGPQVDPGVGQHVVYPAGNRLDRDHVASRERNDVLYPAKALLYPLEAVVGAHDELVHFADHPFELRLFLDRKPGVLQKRLPERSLLSEMAPCIPKRLQIEVRYLPLKSGERSLANRGQRLPVEVQERPVLGEILARRVVFAGHAQDHVAALIVVHLKNVVTIEAANEPVVPLTLRLLGKRDLDPDRIRGRGLGLGIRQVEIERIEDDPPARTQIPEAEPQCVEHRGLARIVLADQYRHLVQIEIKPSDPAKILYVESGDLHRFSSRFLVMYCCRFVL